MSEKTDANAIEELARAIFEKEAPPGLVWEPRSVVTSPDGLTMGAISEEERDAYRRLAAAQITRSAE